MKNVMQSLSVLLLIALSACTFEPLYGSLTPDGRPSIGSNLSSIEIAPISGRVGIELRNELIFVFTGGGQPVNNGRYRLDIALQENVTQSQYEQVSGRATSGLQYTAANYVLTDKTTNKKVYQSRSFARTTFDEDIQRFASIRAQRNAEDRTMKVLAQEIRNSLASYFAQAGQQ
jgi:LPS-assembly lipoprotein